MSKSTVACFSDLEVVKASLLGQGRGKVSPTVNMAAHLQMCICLFQCVHPVLGPEGPALDIE